MWESDHAVIDRQIGQYQVERLRIHLVIQFLFGMLGQDLDVGIKEIIVTIAFFHMI